MGGNFGTIVRFLGPAFIADFDIAVALEVFAVLAPTPYLGRLALVCHIAANRLIWVYIADNLDASSRR